MRNRQPAGSGGTSRLAALLGGQLHDDIFIGNGFIQHGENSFIYVMLHVQRLKGPVMKKAHEPEERRICPEGKIQGYAQTSAFSMG